MPKVNGVSKTYSFSRDTVEKLTEMCKTDMRTQTNLIEVLIDAEYKRRECNGEGSDKAKA